MASPMSKLLAQNARKKAKTNNGASFNTRDSQDRVHVKVRKHLWYDENRAKRSVSLRNLTSWSPRPAVFVALLVHLDGSSACVV